jgi:uncharacterized membrane protein YedE/YeeE
MTGFTPIPALVGGVLVGLAASMVLFSHGKISGISGIYGGLLAPPVPDRGFRVSFLLGLVTAGLLAYLVRPELFPAVDVTPLYLAIPAGLLVGFGTRLGNGCTSGHGVCGISRLSTRSLVATGTFMVTGAIAVVLTGILGAR